jgi:hypothetical protein
MALLAASWIGYFHLACNSWLRLGNVLEQGIIVKD